MRRLATRRSFLIAVGLGLLPAGLSFAQSAAPATTDAPAIKVGDSWTFDRTDPSKSAKLYTSAMTATAVGDGGIRIESKRTDNGQTSTLTHTKELNLVSTEISGGKAAYDPYYASFAFPLEVGKTWERENTYTRTYESDRKVVAKLSGKVIGWEKVTVPAGTFDALRIEVKSKYNGQNMRGRWFGQSTDTIWYAPSARLYVKWLFEDGGGDGTHKNAWLDELVAYKLVP
jgi:hypothetical protein